MRCSTCDGGEIVQTTMPAVVCSDVGDKDKFFVDEQLRDFIANFPTFQTLAVKEAATISDGRQIQDTKPLADP
jgi:hypothetical protein